MKNSNAFSHAMIHICALHVSDNTPLRVQLIHNDAITISLDYHCSLPFNGLPLITLQSRYGTTVRYDILALKIPCGEAGSVSKFVIITGRVRLLST